MKKELKKLYYRVGKKRFCKGMKNAVRLFALLLAFLIFGAIVAGCREEKPKEVKIYEVVQEEMVFETVPGNDRVKMPVVKDVVYYIIANENES